MFRKVIVIGIAATWEVPRQLMSLSAICEQMRHLRILFENPLLLGRFKSELRVLQYASQLVQRWRMGE